MFTALLECRIFSANLRPLVQALPETRARVSTHMVSSDDDRDAGLKFGFRAQQRMRERERREKSKDERKKREREADEEREMVKDVAKRIAEGDLRARVLAKVAVQLKTDEVQARLTEQVDTAQAATRKVCRVRVVLGRPFGVRKTFGLVALSGRGVRCGRRGSPQWRRRATRRFAMRSARRRSVSPRTRTLLTSSLRTHGWWPRRSAAQIVAWASSRRALWYK